MAKIFGLPTIGDLNAACVRMREFCKNIILVRILSPILVVNILNILLSIGEAKATTI